MLMRSEMVSKALKMKPPQNVQGVMTDETLYGEPFSATGELQLLSLEHVLPRT